MWSFFTNASYPACAATTATHFGRLSSPLEEMTEASRRSGNSDRHGPERSHERKSHTMVASARNRAQRAVTVVSRHLSRVVPFLSPSCCRRFTLWLFLLTVAGVLFTFVECAAWTYKHSSCFTSQTSKTTWTVPDTSPRFCPDVKYPTIDDSDSVLPQRICLVTLTDGATEPTSTPWLRSLSTCRDFSSTGSLISKNHAQYAKHHGYQYTMKNGVLDGTRPPAWSKIKAVEAQLTSGKCDWVMWLDADVVIMNQSLPLERLIAKDADLVVTPDGSFAVSSGVWLIKNTAWSTKFLETWWNLRRYVRAKGLSLSGDNKAFGHLVQEYLEDETHREHIHVTPARCTMNSNAVFVDKKSTNADVDVSSKRNDWRGSTTYYHKGDFIAHAAGIDRKSLAIQQLVEQAM